MFSSFIIKGCYCISETTGITDSNDNEQIPKEVMSSNPIRPSIAIEYINFEQFQSNAIFYTNCSNISLTTTDQNDRDVQDDQGNQGNRDNQETQIEIQAKAVVAAGACRATDL